MRKIVYFKDIRPTDHYIQFHEKDVPWNKVLEIVFETKSKRKKGNKIEIEIKGFYLLCELKDDILYVINAKKS